MKKSAEPPREYNKRILARFDIVFYVRTKNGLSAEQIASATDKEIEEVKAIIAGKS